MEKQPVKPAIDLTLLDSMLAEKKDQKGTLIPVLQAAQNTYGYLPKRRCSISVKK